MSTPLRIVDGDIATDYAAAARKIANQLPYGAIDNVAQAAIEFVIQTLDAQKLYETWRPVKYLQDHQNSLVTQGTKTASVHPFTFWEHVVNHPQRKEQAYRILHPETVFGMLNPTRLLFAIVRNQFINLGFNVTFTNYHAEGKLEPHIDAFASAVGKPSAEIRNFVTQEQWEDLLKFILQ